jgi:hypothetical protein
MIMGQGCGDLAPTAPECIKQGNTPCQIVLVSGSAMSVAGALSGTVDIDMTGGFMGGAIKEGSVQRTGCTGVWNPATSQLTVDCGNVGSPQSCIAILTRTGNVCP